MKASDKAPAARPYGSAPGVAEPEPADILLRCKSRSGDGQVVIRNRDVDATSPLAFLKNELDQSGIVNIDRDSNEDFRVQLTGRQGSPPIVVYSSASYNGAIARLQAQGVREASLFVHSAPATGQTVETAVKADNDRKRKHSLDDEAAGEYGQRSRDRPFATGNPSDIGGPDAPSRLSVSGSSRVEQPNKASNALPARRKSQVTDGSLRVKKPSTSSRPPASTGRLENHSRGGFSTTGEREVSVDSSDENQLTQSLKDLQFDLAMLNKPFNRCPDSSNEGNEDDDEDDDDSLTGEENKDARKSRLEKERADQKRMEEEFFGAKASAAINDRAGEVMERCKEHEWRAAALFFGVPIQRFQAGQATELPKHWGLPDGVHFFPYQLVDAYQLYQQELSDVNGGVLASMMGMGKTRSMVLVLLVGHVHFISWINNRDGEEDCQAEACTCDLPCVRNPTSIFYGQEPRLAPTIISGHGKAVDSWREEFSQILVPSQWFDPQRCKYPIRIAWMQAEKHLHFEPLSDDEKTELRVQVDSHAYVDRLNSDKAGLKRTFTAGGKSCEESPEWKLTSGLSNHKRATPSRPSPTSARFILVSGHNTVSKRVFDLLDSIVIKVSREIIVRGREQRVTQSIVEKCWQVWGRTIYDEFHNAKGEDTKFSRFYQNLRSANRGYQWKSWALSGTPFETGMAEVLVFVSLALVGLEDETGRSRWNQTNQAILGSDGTPGTQLEDVFEYISRLVRKNRGQTIPNGIADARAWVRQRARAGDGRASVEGLMEEMKDMIEAGSRVASVFILRRTLKTRDPWGQRISAVKGVYKTSLRPCRDAQWSQIVDDAATRCRAILANEGKPADGSVFTRHELVAIATYPMLALFKALVYEEAGSGRWQSFTSKHLQEEMANPFEPSFYTQNVELLAEGSPKFQELKKIMEKAKENGSKVVVGSCKPVTQLITYLATVQEYGRDAVAFAPGASGNVQSVKENIEQWRLEDERFVLVASVGAFAEAITLVEADTIVLMEPHDRMTKQDQFLFRVYRIGQESAVCRGYVLYNPACEKEVDVLRRQHLKASSKELLQGARGGKLDEGAIGVVRGSDVRWDVDDDIPLIMDGIE